MSPPAIKDMKTFVPCGPNGQDESIAFYQALGFKLLWGGGENAVCEFDTGFGHRFLLLEKHNVALANNLMIQFWVEDVDAWASYLKGLRLTERFPLVKVSDPAVQPWGWRILYIWDPAGVLLHFGEPHTEANRDFFETMPLS